MKKRIFILLPMLVLSSVFLFSAYTAPPTEKKLFCDSKGDFTVLAVSDPQCDTREQWQEARDELSTLIDRCDPDLVLINGDMNSYNKIPSDMWALFISPINKKGIFWATTNGNHDPYTDQSYNMYKSYKNCLNNKLYRGNPYFDAKRPMNYVLPIYSNDGSRLVFALYAMDSGGINKNGYEGLTKTQIDWYVNTSNTLRRQNGGRAVTAAMFLHIPITQTIDMFYSNAQATEATAKKSGGLYPVFGVTNQGEAGIRDYFCENNTHIAESFLHTTAPQNDRGIFKRILKQNDVKMLVFGHEHKTNIAGSYKGVLLSFAGKLSTGCYSDIYCRGGRVIRINQENPQKFTTEWIGSLPSSKDLPPIYSDGTLALSQ